MYEVDDQDRVLRLEGVPQSLEERQSPLFFATKHCVVLARSVERDFEKDKDFGLSVRVIDRVISPGPVAPMRLIAAIA